MEGAGRGGSPAWRRRLGGGAAGRRRPVARGAGARRARTASGAGVVDPAAAVNGGRRRRPGEAARPRRRRGAGEGGLGPGRDGGEGRPQALAGRRLRVAKRSPRGHVAAAGRSAVSDDGGDGFFLGFGRGRSGFGMGEVYIGIEGARRVEMRCGFRPRDRDRTL